MIEISESPRDSSKNLYGYEIGYNQYYLECRKTRPLNIARAEKIYVYCRERFRSWQLTYGYSYPAYLKAYTYFLLCILNEVTEERAAILMRINGKLYLVEQVLTEKDGYEVPCDWTWRTMQEPKEYS